MQVDLLGLNETAEVLTDPSTKVLDTQENGCSTVHLLNVGGMDSVLIVDPMTGGGVHVSDNGFTGQFDHYRTGKDDERGS